MENIIYKCEFCNKEYKNKRAYNSHKSNCKQSPKYVKKQKSEKWLEAMHARKGRGTNQFLKARELNMEIPKVSEATRKKISDAVKGDKNPACKPENREKISVGMKKAHAEERAHNIGNCRWNNQPSYPERWFITMMKNEFGQEVGKDYFREVSFHRYSLDFAWIDKKICIEIDGEQHERFQEQKERDIRKDNLLKKEGWIELRKPWKDIFNNPKSFIEEIKILLGRC